MSGIYAPFQETQRNWSKIVPIVFIIIAGIYSVSSAAVGVVFGFTNHYQGILSALFVLLVFGGIIALTLFVRSGKLDTKYIFIIIILAVALLFSSFFIFTTTSFTADNFTDCFKEKAIYDKLSGNCVSCSPGECLDFDVFSKDREARSICFKPEDAKLVEACSRQ
ncbi:MAG: hypothetical protein EZS28_009040 [Streblomastix strix]|uniref:Uncharacterized protein n=1 Tax=Streblomastix strix TaxID=222440 RepID=A0A5J4WKP7_9EUKA|nr:MAG: hypothetical protein EZS28_009040 [Streblomastix strix]